MNESTVASACVLTNHPFEMEQKISGPIKNFGKKTERSSSLEIPCGVFAAEISCFFAAEGPKMY